MGFFRNLISAGDDIPPPEGLIEHAEQLARSASMPALAKTGLDLLAPEISKYAPEARFLLSCGTLLEKTRVNEGMLDAWVDLRELFPDELLPVRMMMRWYRRINMMEDGIVKLRVVCPDILTNAIQAEQLIFGLVELKDYSGLDSAIDQIVAAHPKNVAIQIQYAKCLVKQERILKAQAFLKSVVVRGNLSPSTQKIIEDIEGHVEALEKYDVVDGAAMIGKIVETFTNRTPRPLSTGGLGQIIFHTGQLGAGGAERQMTRIAAAFKQRFDNETPVSGHKLLVSPKVCVRHTNPATKSGFFKPALEELGVEVCVLNDETLPTVADTPEMSGELLAMMKYLPEDIYQNTLKLVRYFRETKAEYVYCWQDGGVLVGALAALIAGVPRIITSFRGMPPNQRPELLRPQMPYLYKALRHVPGVSFSANNGVAAHAYEEWLGFDSGEIYVIGNAVPAMVTDADENALKEWENIIAKSSECSRTVLGIFRFEPVKNPLKWVDVAAAFTRKHTDTRFVAFGTGTLLQECRQKVIKLGLEGRIFLCEPTLSVGYFLHKADVLLHLARTEGLPNVVIEGQLSSTPVVATPAGGTIELIKDQATGFLVSQAADPPVPEVIDLLERCFANPELGNKITKAARKFAEQQFSVDSILEKTVAYFNNVRT